MNGAPTKFRTLCIIEIVQLILAVLAVIGGLIGADFLAILCVLVSLAAAIIYLVVVMGLKEYNDLFRTAGWFYLSKEILNFITELYSLGLVKDIFGIIAVILNIMYILKFCKACEELLEDKHRGVADSWNRYGGYMICYLVATIIFKIISLILTISLPMGIFALVGVVCGIIFMVWHIILLGDTDAVLSGRTV